MRDRKSTFDSERLQRYLHGLTVAAVPLLVAYGLISAEEAPLWVALGTAVLAPGVALAIPRTTGKPPKNDAEKLGE